MEERKYTNLKALVGDSFIIRKVGGYNFKKWDATSSRMISENQWFEGSRKMYWLETDKGSLDLSEGQLGSIFAKCQHGGVSDIIGVEVQVKSNGKEGIDIRYYLNPQKKVKETEEQDDLTEMFGE